MREGGRRREHGCRWSQSKPIVRRENKVRILKTRRLDTYPGYLSPTVLSEVGSVSSLRGHQCEVIPGGHVECSRIYVKKCVVVCAQEYGQNELCAETSGTAYCVQGEYELYENTYKLRNRRL